MLKRMMTGLAALTLVASLAQAGDWPQWRGPQANGHADEKGLLKQWPKGGPKLAWVAKNCGSGYTAPIVVGNGVYLMGCFDADEYMIALDNTGKEVWKTKIGPVFDFPENAWSRGPNGSPCFSDGHVYGLSSNGMLACVEAKTGKLVWSKDLVKTMGAQVNNVLGFVENFGWGFSWSPVVDGDKLVITPGGPKGLFAALDKKTGKVLWQSATITDQCTYVTPLVAEIAGTKQYLTMVQDGVLAVDPKTGNQLWRYKRSSEYGDVVCTSPVVWENNVLITATKGGTEVVEITKNGGAFAAKVGQRSRRLSNANGGLVKVEGFLYGAHDLREWKCFDLTNMRDSVWDSKPTDPKPGALNYADGHLYCISQNTDMVSLVEANPKAYTLKGSFLLPMKSKLRKPNGKLWTHPVIANGCLYVRDQELLYCYNVK